MGAGALLQGSPKGRVSSLISVPFHRGCIPPGFPRPLDPTALCCVHHLQVRDMRKRGCRRGLSWDPRSTPIFVYSDIFQGSAVCVYSMNDVRRAFLGPFAHKEGPLHQWVAYQGRVPYPRPGMVRSPVHPSPRPLPTWVELLTWDPAGDVLCFLVGSITLIRWGPQGKFVRPLRCPRARLGGLLTRFSRTGFYPSCIHTPLVLAISSRGCPSCPLTHTPCMFISFPPNCQCPSKTFGTFSSTKDFPDDVIQFARNHPLMYNSVLPMGGRPLFLQVGAGYTFTQIATDHVVAADGHYDVLFIGTGESRHDPM